jgi:tripartite-type tricarboxylate transporter receptor subunit TctC
MRLPRRKFLPLAVSAAALPFMPRLAKGQTYPSRPVHIIVGFAPGSAFDILARVIGQRLSERTGDEERVAVRTRSRHCFGRDASGGA